MFRVKVEVPYGPRPGPYVPAQFQHQRLPLLRTIA